MGLVGKLRSSGVPTLPSGAPPLQAPFDASVVPLPVPSPPSAPLLPSVPVPRNPFSAPVLNKLRSIVHTNNLHAFYDERKLQEVANRLSGVDFPALARSWRMSTELVFDLAPLALYDVVFYCDDSGSMAFEENGERIEDLKLILGKVADVVAKFDDDGISVRFMNSSVAGDNITTAAKAIELVDQVRFSGQTPLGTKFDDKIIRGFVRPNMPKPVLAIVITDGVPIGEDRYTILHKLRALRTGRHALAVQIAQVGRDPNVQRFLGELDTDPEIGDMIDCTSYYELEAEEMARKGIDLTPELWLLKMCLGAIDPEYNNLDE